MKGEGEDEGRRGWMEKRMDGEGEEERKSSHTHTTYLSLLPGQEGLQGYLGERFI